MKRLFTLLPLAALLFSGCAASPSGGPAQVSRDRLEVALATRGDIDPNYYYAVAFDDTAADDFGPRAIIGGTPILNRVVGGEFRVAVVYHLGQFTTYYRTDPDDPNTERVIPNPFIGSAQAGLRDLRFTLNLNTTVNTVNNEPMPLFPNLATTDRFLINFVTTPQIYGPDAQNNLQKPVDTFGTATVDTPLQFLIGGTRRSFNPDDEDDLSFYNTDFNAANASKLDVIALELNLTRDRQ